MRRGLFLAFAILIFTLVAYAAHLWAVALEESLNEFKPPFEGQLPSDRSGMPLTQQVVLIFVEGLGEDASHQMPFLNRLREIGAQGKVCWVEAPGRYTLWASLLTGASTQHTFP